MRIRAQYIVLQPGTGRLNGPGHQGLKQLS